MKKALIHQFFTHRQLPAITLFHGEMNFICVCTASYYFYEDFQSSKTYSHNSHTTHMLNALRKSCLVAQTLFLYYLKHTKTCSMNGLYIFVVSLLFAIITSCIEAKLVFCPHLGSGMRFYKAVFSLFCGYIGNTCGPNSYYNYYYYDDMESTSQKHTTG